MKLKKLPRQFYADKTIHVAKKLLGKYLVKKTDGIEHIVRIVEVEAYLGAHDLAAHSARGLTERTKVMFGPPGHAYVYMIYGMYYCLNVITEAEGHPSGILIRAVEPIQNVTGRTQGPGLLCKAMNIDKRLYGHDLLSDDFYLAETSCHEKIVIIKRPRIGVHYAGNWASKLLRFYIKGNIFVSKK